MGLPGGDAVKQFIKFGLVGVSNSLIALLVYYLVLWLAPALYWMGNALGWVVSVGNSFYWNNKYVFRGSGSGVAGLLRKLGRTYLSYGATFFLGAALLCLEVELLRWPKEIAPICNMAVTIPLNFLLNKFWAFRETRED